MLRRVLAAAFAMIAVTLLSGQLPAAAHAALVSSDPEDASTLETLPDDVTLTFDESVDEPAFVTVNAPDGTTIASGEANVFDATVSQPLSGQGSAATGTYTVAYRVTSFDGHPVTGTLAFNVGRASETVQPAAEPSDPANSGGNSFISDNVASLTIAMAAITLAICLAILKSARNRQRQGDA